MPPSEKVIDLYRKHGLGWAALRGQAPVHEQHWIDWLCALLAPSSMILDLGCGTGQPLAAGLVARGFRITGVDTAPAMLDVARAAMPEQEWLEQDMRHISLGRRFGGIIAWDSFFHLNHHEQAAMFPLFRDHALPEAPLLFTTGPVHGESIGELAGEPLYHASLAPEAYRSLLASHGFAMVEHRANDPDAGGRTVWLAKRDVP